MLSHVAVAPNFTNEISIQKDKKTTCKDNEIGTLVAAEFGISVFLEFSWMVFVCHTKSVYET